MTATMNKMLNTIKAISENHGYYLSIEVPSNWDEKSQVEVFIPSYDATYYNVAEGATYFIPIWVSFEAWKGLYAAGLLMTKDEAREWAKSHGCEGTATAWSYGYNLNMKEVKTILTK